MTLLDRLEALFPGASGRSRKQWLAHGRVRVNGAVARRGDATIAVGDRVELGAPPPPAFPSALRRIYEDDDIVVIDKPAGLLTIATESERERTAYRVLAAYVAGQTRNDRARRLFIVHRLDRETSGLLVFAKSGAAKGALQAQFEARAVERRYVAVVEGRVREPEGTLRSRLRVDQSLRVRPTRRRDVGREAITHYRVLETRPTTTLLELSLTTGRRGQIRSQLAALGHPIAGDRDYGATTDPLRRVCLHATRLSFVGPSGRRATFDSPAPGAFARAR
ncbi:MAG: RluA family pseudouridine synthase [Candidatus Rokubacteria bacterium]|nr:RluA family pseudouridine synthase [Candidatus Rokubacteria bacterium]